MYDLAINSSIKNHSIQNTRQRLLEAGGEVFAESGFRAATIREICKRAGANIAAVNYHFGDKETLYSAVLQYAHRCASEKYPHNIGLKDNAGAEERLSVFIRSFMLRIFDDGRPAWHGKLMLRELADPTSALDAVVDAFIRPLSEALAGIVTELIGKNAGREVIRNSANSIMGQCLFYCHARPVLARLSSQGNYGKKEIDRLTDHIISFSLEAIRHMKNEGKGR